MKTDYKSVLDLLDKTLIGNLELKIALSNAVEKQIPKRVNIIIKLRNRKCGYCPNCNGTVQVRKSFLKNIKGDCCSWCGQRLDWNIEKEIERE